jgi:hypothetical protein
MQNQRKSGCHRYENWLELYPGLNEHVARPDQLLLGRHYDPPGVPRTGYYNASIATNIYIEA